MSAHDNHYTTDDNPKIVRMLYNSVKSGHNLVKLKLDLKSCTRKPHANFWCNILKDGEKILRKPSQKSQTNGHGITIHVQLQGFHWRRFCKSLTWPGLSKVQNGGTKGSLMGWEWSDGPQYIILNASVKVCTCKFEYDIYIVNIYQSKANYLLFFPVKELERFIAIWSQCDCNFKILILNARSC